MSLNRTVRWRGLGPATLEHCQILAQDRGSHLRGAIVAPAYGLFYRIDLDQAGRVRMARIERTDGRVLELVADGAGSWSNEQGKARPDLQGCIDIDLWPTPLTNSLPIWRSTWIDDQPQSFAMSWIDGDEMTVRRDDQVYTKLDEARFRFQNANGFERVLDVDADGLVVVYPGLFERA